ncbi:MAG TPA: 16S rRNA (guanine(527)-N(7))-methyltransferase RsmG [Terriglobales bacterium]|nr:16S rRNA (guanine(527)-N(7))-methyltransferase RsmG [Terriglobales bacterium]
MERCEIAALLNPLLPEPLDEGQLQLVQAYVGLLMRWNTKTNLTAIRNEKHIVLRHFGESLFAASLLLPRNSSAHVIDVGSGAGFPGLPLKIHAPAIVLTLIESQNKKATFLREVARTLRLPDVTVFQARAEQFTGPADLVMLRAVEHFADILPTAARLVRRAHRNEGVAISTIGENEAIEALESGPSGERAQVTEAPGRLALLIGKGQVEIAHELLPSFAWESPVPLPGSAARVVLVGRPISA